MLNMSRPPSPFAAEIVSADEPFTYNTPVRLSAIVYTTWCQLFIAYVFDEEIAEVILS